MARTNQPRRNVPKDHSLDFEEFVNTVQVGMRNFSKDVNAIREEVQFAISALRKEATEGFTTLNATKSTMCMMLKEVSDRSDEVNRILTEQSVNVDFTPLRDQIRIGLESQQSWMRNEIHRMETRLAEKVAEVGKEVEEGLERQKQGTETISTVVQSSQTLVVAQIGDMEKVMDSHMGQLLSSMQQSLTDSATQSARMIRRMQLENSKHHAAIGPCVEDQVLKHVKGEPVNVDFAQVLRQIKYTQHAANMETAKVLRELARTQRELGVDYTRAFLQLATSSVPAHAFAPHPLQIDSSLCLGEHADEQLLCVVPADEVRVRDLSVQTDNEGLCDFQMQTEDVQPNAGRRKTQARKHHGAMGEKKEAKPKQVFTDADAMKKKAREMRMKPQYNVYDYYKKTGIVQRLAKSALFENITFAVIFANTIWIAVDTDNNNAVLLVDAELLYQIAENIFCTYFTIEIMIRFSAFAQKRRCVRDFWFVFDSLLLFLMVAETWALSLFVVLVECPRPCVGGNNQQMIKMLRMLKIFRMLRLCRLMRTVPEIVILMKGIGVALRSVMVFLLLWTILLYVYAVVCRQLSFQYPEMEAMYFWSVPASMNTLVLDGILPQHARLVRDMTDAEPWLWILIISFLVLAVITIMNMLIGVLVDVVAAVAATEKEGMIVSSVSSQLRHVMGETLNINLNDPISKADFRSLLLKPEISSILQNVKVDVLGLMETVDVIYEDLERVEAGKGMSFEDMVELVLNMRGTNQATVKDVKELIRLMKHCVGEMGNAITKSIDEELTILRKDIQAIRDDDSGASEDERDRATSSLSRLMSADQMSDQEDEEATHALGDDHGDEES
jgi:voltage-gated sodium channel